VGVAEEGSRPVASGLVPDDGDTGVAGHDRVHRDRRCFLDESRTLGLNRNELGASLVQEAASHADPRTTMRYDRARRILDRHATYIVSTFIASATRPE